MACIKAIGFTGDPWSLNHDDKLPAVMGLLKQGYQKWGAVGLLNYVRGGETGFRDGHSYSAYEYRNGVSTIAKQLRADQSLF